MHIPVTAQLRLTVNQPHIKNGRIPATYMVINRKLVRFWICQNVRNLATFEFTPRLAITDRGLLITQQQHKMWVDMLPENAQDDRNSRKTMYITATHTTKIYHGSPICFASVKSTNDNSATFGHSQGWICKISPARVRKLAAQGREIAAQGSEKPGDLGFFGQGWMLVPNPALVTAYVLLISTQWFSVRDEKAEHTFLPSTSLSMPS